MDNGTNVTSEKDLGKVSGGIIAPAKGTAYCEFKNGNWSFCNAPNHQNLGGKFSTGGHDYQYRICLNCGTKWLDCDESGYWWPVKDTK